MQYIHDTVHATSGRRPDEMARDAGRHGKDFSGLLKWYFGK